MPDPDPIDQRMLDSVVRRLLAEGEATTVDTIADRMLSAAGPSDRDTSGPRAMRYARAVIRAAAVEATIAELTDKLAEAEWYRAHAEAIADRLITRLDLGDQQVVATGLEDAISDDVNALVSLADGRVWVRDQTVYMDRDKSKYWLHAETSERAVTVYEWPLEGGPFIALPEHWYLRHLVDTARRRDTDEQKIRDLTRSRKGYEYPYTGGLAKMLEAVLYAADRQRSDLSADRDHGRQKLYDIRRAVADSTVDPRARIVKVLEVLDRPARDAPPTAPAGPRCSQCGHQPHSAAGCLNMASDNDCDCTRDSRPVDAL